MAHIDRLRLLVLCSFAATPALAACEGSVAGTPVAADALCGELAVTICEADAACFPSSELGDCEQLQRDACAAVVQPLIDDPRLGYDELRAGAFMDSLRAQAETCWDTPVDYDGFLAAFAGTGVAGADCTPARATPASLRTSSLSCADGTACRLYLRADSSTEGVCEARRDSACSHPLDCGAGRFCSLPAAWQVGVWGECRPLRSDGWSCSSDLECASRQCEGTCRARRDTELPLSVPYTDVVLDAAPIAYLRFAETTSRMSDASGHGHGGELVGSPARDLEGAIAGDASGAIRLSGDAQYVHVAPLGELESSRELSVECWFLRDDTTASQPMIEFSDGTALGPHVWNHDRGDRLYANFVSAEAEGQTIMSAEGAVTAAEWHHVVATFDGAVGRLYLDGTRIGETPVSGTLRLDGDLYIGHRAAMGETPASSFAGAIDEVAVYDRALDAATIRRHHDAGVAGVVANAFPLFSWLTL